jgi:hypothetical protein
MGKSFDQFQSRDLTVSIESTKIVRRAFEPTDPKKMVVTFHDLFDP